MIEVKVVLRSSEDDTATEEDLNELANYLQESAFARMDASYYRTSDNRYIHVSVTVE